jgi:hypothetical protein
MITAKVIGDFLRVSERAIQRLVNDPDCPICYKPGIGICVRESTLNRWIDQKTAKRSRQTY